MDLTNLSDLRPLLSKHSIVLAKTYGQHFLVDRSVLETIIKAAFPANDARSSFARASADRRTTHSILEVGPGAGTLTVELAKRAGEVVAVERDRRFIAVLKETLAEFSNVRIVEADALKVSFSDLIANSVAGKLDPRLRGDDKTTPYDVVSNLPYEISTPFLWKILFEEPNRPERAVLLLQAELVDRLLAKPPSMNLLSLLVGLVSEAKRVGNVSGSAFYPSPKVESAIVLLQMKRLDEAALKQVRGVLAVAKSAFAAPRKKLKSTIGSRAGRFEDRRPAELGVVEWLQMTS